MDVVHAVDDDPSDFFETLEGTHCRDSVSLYQDVAFGEKLNCLESALFGHLVKDDLP